MLTKKPPIPKTKSACDINQMATTTGFGNMSTFAKTFFDKTSTNFNSTVLRTTHFNNSSSLHKTINTNTNFNTNTNYNKKEDQKEFINKFSIYLNEKKKQIDSLKRFNAPRQQIIKKMLNETKSDSNAFTRTFSFNFIKTNDYKELSSYFQEGHKLRNRDLNFNDNPDEDQLASVNKAELQVKNELFRKYNIIPNITNKEKERHHLKNNSVSKIEINDAQYYKNQYDSYQMIQTNKRLHDHLLIKASEEQIKAYLTKHFQQEEEKLKIDLMPNIQPMVVQTQKKIQMNLNYEASLKKQQLNNMSEIGLVARDILFIQYKTLYVTPICNFLITPTSREECRMIQCYNEKTNETKYYMYGGINRVRLGELWECVTSQSERPSQRYKWKRIKPEGDVTMVRSGHTVCCYNNELVIYGGIEKDERADYFKKDILFYSIEQNRFFSEEGLNKASVSWRKYHIAEIVGQYMFVQGGVNEMGITLNDSWALDLIKMKWVSTKIVGDLPYLHSHCSCQVFNPYKKSHSKFTLFKMFTDKGTFPPTQIAVEGIFIFGGMDENGKCSNNLYVINGKPLAIHSIKADGMPPTPRCSFTMNWFEKLNVIIIHGGRNEYNSEQSFLNDFYFLDVQLLAWIRMEVQDTVPSRGSHCASIYDNELIIFGGINDKTYLKSDLLIVGLDIIENSHLARRYKAKKKKQANEGGGKKDEENPNDIVSGLKLVNNNKEKNNPVFTSDNVQDSSKSFFQKYPKQKEQLIKRMEEMKTNALYNSVNNKGLLYKNK